jgi:hypothetical protein
MIVMPFFVLVKGCGVIDKGFEDIGTLGYKAVQVLGHLCFENYDRT